jgi:hypothetical protein
VRRTNLLITNQFGQIRVDTIKPDLLFVPAHKSLVSQPPPPDNNAHAVDHYKCYRVRLTPGTPRFPRGVTAEVADQFTSPAKTLSLKKPRHLCTPVDKNGEGIKEPAGHLLCYKAKPVRGEPKHTAVTAFVTDQFVAGQMTTRKEAELCVPSLKTP